MGAIRPPKRAKLLVGLLSGDPDLMRLARQRLTKRFGDVDFETELWPFTATEYYRAELGEDVQRQFVFFKDLVSVEQLAHIKRETNALEERICEDTARPPTMRPVNVDPGYITLSKLVLASTKDHAHRIYIGRGIYAEVTLRFESGGWKAWPWTYPDYAAKTYHGAFMQARESLKKELSKAQ